MIARFCPVDEHDGGKAPITRLLAVTVPNQVSVLHLELCEYCAEGHTARFVEAGLVVTVRKVAL